MNEAPFDSTKPIKQAIRILSQWETKIGENEELVAGHLKTSLNDVSFKIRTLLEGLHDFCDMYRPIYSMVDNDKFSDHKKFRYLTELRDTYMGKPMNSTSLITSASENILAFTKAVRDLVDELNKLHKKIQKEKGKFPRLSIMIGCAILAVSGIVACIICPFGSPFMVAGCCAAAGGGAGFGVSCFNQGSYNEILRNLDKECQKKAKYVANLEKAIKEHKDKVVKYKAGYDIVQSFDIYQEEEMQSMNIVLQNIPGLRKTLDAMELALTDHSTMQFEEFAMMAFAGAAGAAVGVAATVGSCSNRLVTDCLRCSDLDMTLEEY